MFGAQQKAGVELRVNEPGCGCRCRCRPTRPMIRLVGKVCSGADEAKDVYNRRSTARWLYRIDTEAIVDFRWERASFNPKSCTRNEVRRTQRRKSERCLGLALLNPDKREKEGRQSTKGVDGEDEGEGEVLMLSRWRVTVR